jgi:hypothetical protein
LFFLWVEYPKNYFFLVRQNLKPEGLIKKIMFGCSVGMDWKTVKKAPVKFIDKSAVLGAPPSAPLSPVSQLLPPRYFPLGSTFLRLLRPTPPGMAAQGGIIVYMEHILEPGDVLLPLVVLYILFFFLFVCV